MELIVNKQSLRIKDIASLKTGNVETYPIQLTFSEEYKNLAKTIIYLADEETIKQSVTNETEVNIPFEVLEKLREHLYIGVFAYEIKDKLIVKRYSTNLVSVPVSKGSYIDGYEPVIEPSVWERYIYEMQRILDDAELVLSETNQIKEDTNQIKNQTEIIKNETNKIKEDTEEIKNIVKDFATAIQFATFDVDNDMQLGINTAEKLANVSFYFDDEKGELGVEII